MSERRAKQGRGSTRSTGWPGAPMSAKGAKRPYRPAISFTEAD